MNPHEKTMLLAVAMNEIGAIVRRYGPTLAAELGLLFQAAAGAARKLQKKTGADGMEDTQNVAE